MVYAAVVEQISMPLANNSENEITETMTCSRSTANALGSCKRNDTDGVCWRHRTDHYLVETYAMTNKYKLAQSYM